jgi:hypothetical protein
VAAYLDEETIPGAAIHQHAAVILDDFRHVDELEFARSAMEAANRLLVANEKPEMKTVRVTVHLVLQPLEDQRETLAIDEDGERGRRPTGFEPEIEKPFEEIDIPLNIGDLQVQMIELHGVSLAGRKSALTPWDHSA